MKKIIAAALCLVLALLFAGCGTKDLSSEKEAETPDESKEIALEETQDTAPVTKKAEVPTGSDSSGESPLCVAMSVTDDPCLWQKASFILTNTGDEEYTYGPEYSLEKQHAGEWAEIVLDEPLSWNAVVLRLAPHSSAEFEVDWSFGYGELEQGTYRLRKTVSDAEGNRTAVYAEFTVPELCGLPLAPEGFTKPE